MLLPAVGECQGAEAYLTPRKQGESGPATQGENGVGRGQLHGADGAALGLAVAAEDAVLAEERLDPVSGAPVPRVGEEGEGAVERGRAGEARVPADHRARGDARPTADALDGRVDGAALAAVRA